MGIMAPTPASATATTASIGKGKKKKKAPRKAVHIAAPKMKSRRKARQVTTGFHRLTHELDQLKKDAGVSTSEKKERMAEIQAQLEALGGRSAYQDASILSTSFHKTSKWVFQLLTRFERRPKSKEPSLRTLEVGAINTQLLSCPWLDVRAIDLNSKHDKIEQCDFFSLQPQEEFHVLVSSMVINCVPDAASRGRMLQLSYAHLKPSGLFFLMLPKLCLSNSKYMTYTRFTQILEAVGFVIKDKKDSPKVSFFCLEKPATTAVQDHGVGNAAGKTDVRKRFPKVLLRPGPKRNDFSVQLG